MSMTPENTTQGWRDLADELTPRQIRHLKQHEGGGARGSNLLQVARMFACENAATVLDDVPLAKGWHVDVAAPEDATWVSPWTFNNGDLRLFRGTRREIHGGKVIICGTQDSDGTVLPRKIMLVFGEGPTNPLDVDAARTAGIEMFAQAHREGADDGMEIAATVLAAADEIDGLEGRGIHKLAAR
jgi:hypothetical protein